MAPQSSTIIDVVIKEMRGILESEENLHILNVRASEFRCMEEILEHNRKKLQDEHEKLPKPVGKCCLEALKDSVEEAKSLINRAKQQRGCFSCCFASKPKTDFSAQKIEWKRKFDDIYQQLQSLSVVAAEIGVQGSERPPKLKSDKIGLQIAESAGPPELISDHTDRQIAKSARSPETKSDHSRQTSESPWTSELKSDGTRQIAESARPLEFKSDRTRQILESASPPNKKYDASAWSPELKNDAFVDRQQIAESIKRDPQKFKDSWSPELKSQETRQSEIVESAGRPEYKGDHTDPQMAKSAPSLEQNSPETRTAESKRPPELKSDDSGKIVKSLWTRLGISNLTRQIRRFLHL